MPASADDGLEAMWRTRLASTPSLLAHCATFAEEELTPKLLMGMKDVGEALAELGLSAEDSAMLQRVLSASPKFAADVSDESDAPNPTTSTSVESSVPAADALRSPPRGWPKTAERAMPFVSKQLRGTKIRQVGELTATTAAPLAGLTLRADDARGNAMRVRDRTGWAMAGGFALMERAELDEAAPASARYVGVPHFWNVTPRGLWVDATPRPHAHLSQLVLVESARNPPPPPPYEAQSANPLVIVAVEGLCNRLRSVLTYRTVAHEQGRPLTVVWRKDDYCPGYFADCFLPIPGVRFLKAPPEGKTLSSLHVASDAHPSVKGTPAEAPCYAVLAPIDALRSTIGAQIEACGQRFAALHVRRTDLHTALPLDQHTKDAASEAFADRAAARGGAGGAVRVYLATDNADTQARFFERYGDDVCAVHARIRKRGALRQTSLQQAVVDLFVACR